MNDAVPKTAHTPGPWRHGTGKPIEDGDCIIASGGEHVVCMGHDYDEYGIIGNDADAHLIAAAPDLLAALKILLAFDEVRHAWDEGPPGEGWQSDGLVSAIARADAAIAKAEQEPA